MRRRILWSLLFVSVFTLLIFAPTSLLLYHNSYEERIIEDLENELDYCVRLYEQGDDISKIVNGNRRLTLISQKGDVIYDSVVDSATMENHLNREEIKEAQSKGYGFSERKSDTLSVKYIYAATALENGNYLRISTEAKTAVAFISLIFVPTIIILIFVFIIVSFLSLYISKILVSPINNINLDAPEENDTYDELAPLLSRIAKDKKKVEEQIKGAEEKRKEFEIISSGLDEGLAIVNKEGTILSYNKSFLSLLSLSSIESTSIFSCFEDGDAKNALINALNGKKEELTFPSGSRIIEEVTYPAVNKGIIILLRDVTERTERENMRKEFTANVSHELKTPLTTISGFAELLMSGDIPREKVIDFSGEIYKEAKRLINLVEDILNLSALDEGEERREKQEEVNLKKVAIDVIEELTFKANKEGVEIIAELEDVSVSGRVKLMHEIIFNLLDNSIRYSKKENAWVKITTRAENSTVFLTVEDNGIGIEKDALPRVFERFYRVDKSRSKESGGTGLGLSIVKNSASQMRGIIKIDSEKGVGTTIGISFPSYVK